MNRIGLGSYVAGMWEMGYDDWSATPPKPPAMYILLIHGDNPGLNVPYRMDGVVGQGLT
jgi:hypothetical protein